MTIYIALEDGLAVVTGRESRWTLGPKLEGHHVNCVTVDPAKPRQVFCGTFDAGLWRSQDAGETWQPCGPGIAHESVMAVAANPLEPTPFGSVIYAGTEPTALYRSEDGGTAWKELASLLQLPSKPSWSFPPRPYTSHVRWITPDVVDQEPCMCVSRRERWSKRSTMDGRGSIDSPTGHGIPTPS